MRNGPWDQTEIQFLKDNYKKLTYLEIAEKLDRSKTAVDLKINRIGLKKSKYKYDQNYFEIIDTQEKAYWLGFIYADGCIQENANTNSCELAIKLQGSDYKHLKKFNKSINGNVNVEVFDSICNLNQKTYSSSSIRIYSAKMVHDLKEHGLCNNKSFVLQFPEINNELLPHFIRGFFDGDGCICDDISRKLVKCDFTCASIEFINSLRTLLYANGISSYIYQETDRIYRLYIRGLLNCDKFLQFIYRDANIFLDRKNQKMIDSYEKYGIAQRLLLWSERASKKIKRERNLES